MRIETGGLLADEQPRGVAELSSSPPHTMPPAPRPCLSAFCRSVETTGFKAHWREHRNPLAWSKYLDVSVIRVAMSQRVLGGAQRAFIVVNFRRRAASKHTMYSRLKTTACVRVISFSKKPPLRMSWPVTR